MAASASPPSSSTPTPPGRGRRLSVLLLGLTALIVTMLCAFALPAVNSGPQGIPIGLSGQQPATSTAAKALAGDEWDVSQYDSERDLRSAIKNRDVMGGLALSSEGVTVYTATAAGPSSATSLTAVGAAIGNQQRTEPSVRDLAPFPEEDARGAGFSSAVMPMIFGGMIPAVALIRLFPGHSGLRLRLAGGVLFAVLAGFAVTAVLHATGSLAGDYWLTSLGMSLGMAALSLALLGLEATLGLPGLGLGAAVMMLVANPLSGFASGPHWLPDGWAAFGQLLPPGASGSLLRANAFFDGTGAGAPALTLTCWTAVGLVLILIADRHGSRRSAPTSGIARNPATA